MAKDLVRVCKCCFRTAAIVFATSAGQPAADVSHPRRLVIKLDLAGVKPEEISVSAQENGHRAASRDWPTTYFHATQWRSPTAASSAR